ncbi:hypothetical protein HETIRDRAFT_163636 [Heterobasidion irregulare TC 32-1]|uniref:Uncharacterized protein n=1 Tax=Heterobasidion irregulare (strain TC 32-1) TaxID=747525 RepID=W4KBR2_HETIT|nr:uncharacterized protein HETIRDRAFT_163636 [Heterobasidion irregulare TC 32-1]ETW83228.1 hypothetical protein HETIRDRAFT_163636 [Heterobasidion irregulare TC 32-1]
MHHFQDRRDYVHVCIYMDDGCHLHILTNNHKGLPFVALHVLKYKWQWLKVKFIEQSQ